MLTLSVPKYPNQVRCHLASSHSSVLPHPCWARHLPLPPGEHVLFLAFSCLPLTIKIPLKLKAHSKGAPGLCHFIQDELAHGGGSGGVHKLSAPLGKDSGQMYGLVFLEFSYLQRNCWSKISTEVIAKGKGWLTGKYWKVKNFRKGAVTELKTEGLKQKRGRNKLLQPQNGVGLSEEEEHSPFKGEQPDSKGYLHSACFHLSGVLEKAKLGAENRSVVCCLPTVWGEVHYKGPQGDLGGHGIYLDCCGGDPIVCIYQNP